MSGYIGIVYGYFLWELVMTLKIVDSILLYFGTRFDDEDDADPTEDKESRDSEEVGCEFVSPDAIKVAEFSAE